MPIASRTGALALCTAAWSAPLACGQNDPEPAAGTTFAAPVRLFAGDKLLGHKRLYPSPVYHDIDGDGRVDIVVGDLRGRITYALRQADPTAIAFGAEQDLKDAAGRILDFANW